MRKFLCLNANNLKCCLGRASKQSKMGLARYFGMDILLSVSAHSICASDIIAGAGLNSKKSTEATDKGSAINENFNSPIFEFRVSYFRPFSKSLRKLTGGGVNYALETTIPVWKGLNIWGGVDYFSKSGTMIGID